MTIANWDDPFLPTLTFDTPGDLGVIYANRKAWSSRVGNIVVGGISLKCTPSFTTGSGKLRIGSLPYSPDPTFYGAGRDIPCGLVVQKVVINGQQIAARIMAGTDYVTLVHLNSNGNTSIVQHSHISSGVEIAIEVSFQFYYEGPPALLGGGMFAPINFAALPKPVSTTTTIYTGVQYTGAYAHHPGLVYFDGQWFAGWTIAATGENDDGSEAFYATSADASTWSAKATISGPPAADHTYEFRGFWVRNGVLRAQLVYDNEGGGRGPDLHQYYKEWNGSGWGSLVSMGANVNADREPILTPDGDWMFASHPNTGEFRIVRGDDGAWSHEVIPHPSDVSLNETSLCVLPDDRIMALIRDNASPGSKRLWQMIYDGTWSAPKRTNFPDARTKTQVLRLSDGRYAMATNPHEMERNPLCLAISDDGWRFDQMVIVRDEATTADYPGTSKVDGYQYPDLFEKDGYLYVIYSINKEDIAVTRIAIVDF